MLVRWSTTTSAALPAWRSVSRLLDVAGVVRLQVDQQFLCSARLTPNIVTFRAPMEAMACHRSCSSAAQTPQQPLVLSSALCDSKPFVTARRGRGRRRRSVVQFSATLAEPRTSQTGSSDFDQPLMQRPRSRESRWLLKLTLSYAKANLTAGCHGGCMFECCSLCQAASHSSTVVFTCPCTVRAVMTSCYVQPATAKYVRIEGGGRPVAAQRLYLPV